MDVSVAYQGPSTNYGTANDPMVGSKIGGVNVFGGGLTLYNRSHQIIGALGVSGDTSCSDHFIAWRTRHNLNLDYLKGAIPGPASLFAGDTTHPDNIIFDITGGVSASGFGHPKCYLSGEPLSLPAVQ